MAISLSSVGKTINDKQLYIQLLPKISGTFSIPVAYTAKLLRIDVRYRLSAQLYLYLYIFYIRSKH
jgi:hypothetical protein